MRQGLFAILLVLAAFSGGALVNGPGLDWARQKVSSLSQTIQAADGGAIEAPTIEESEAGAAVADSSRDPEPSAVPSNSPAPHPTAPLPVADSSPFAGATGASRPEQGGAVEVGDGFDPPPPADPPAVRAPRGPSLASGIPAASPGGAPAAPASPRELPKPPISLLDAAKLRLSDRPATPEGGTDAAPAAEAGKGPAPEGGPPAAVAPQPKVAWADAADSAAPAHAIVPEAAPAQPGPKPGPRSGADPSIRLASERGEGPGSASPGEWNEVRRRMQELGVGRFWVEGEFGGPVIFRCVVPVVGDRAVSQHFEAEGEDLLSAARDALRRIVLWKATEGAP